jgi:hypothetical protein
VLKVITEELADAEKMRKLALAAVEAFDTIKSDLTMPALARQEMRVFDQLKKFTARLSPFRGNTQLARLSQRLGKA